MFRTPRSGVPVRLVGAVVALTLVLMGGPAAPPAGAANSDKCLDSTDAKARAEATAKLEKLRDANGGEPRVDAVVYPRPDYTAHLWSQWGQGIVLPDGRYFSAMGDHCGVNGNAFLFVLDPRTGELRRFSDVLSVVGHQPGEWGYGKIHAAMVRGKGNAIYLSTYWGDNTNIVFGGSYHGDELLRLDTRTLGLKVLGNPVQDQGIPALGGDRANGRVFGVAVDPIKRVARPGDKNGVNAATFFVYDTAAGRVSVRVNDPLLEEFRTVMVDARGRVYVAGTEGRLLEWEPGSDKLTAIPDRLPGQGALLRAATPPAPDGTLYGITDNSYRVFALTPDQKVRDLADAGGYTTSMALSPDGRTVYFVPSGHHLTGADKGSAPLFAVDTKTGTRRVITNLGPLVQKQFGLTVAGSYNISIDKAGQKLFVGLNAGPSAKDDWGEVVLAVVSLT